MDRGQELALFKKAVAAGLLTAKQLQEAQQGLGDVLNRSLVEALVRKGDLTAYQVKCIQTGEIEHLTVGPYRILDKVGEGGAGAVYRALHAELGREVALKILPAEMAKNPTTVARFKREARSAAQLQHGNIVAIYDVGEAAGTHYLALEFVKGKDLYDLIRQKGRLSVTESVHILMQACQALVHAHEMGIVHRDIKPSNFLISADAVVKLADMGLARRFSGDVEEEAQITRDGTTVGTVDYMAPEQAKDSKLADARSDIYALGCTFYHMLTGQVPFRGGSLPDKLLKHATHSRPDPRTVRADIADEVVYILHKMMAKKPAERYQSAEELLADLDDYRYQKKTASAGGLSHEIDSLAELSDGDQTDFDEEFEAGALPSVSGGTRVRRRVRPEQENRRRNLMGVGLGLLPVVVVLLIGVTLKLACPGSDKRKSDESAASSVPATPPTDTEPVTPRDVKPPEDPSQTQRTPPDTPTTGNGPAPPPVQRTRRFDDIDPVATRARFIPPDRSGPTVVAGATVVPVKRTGPPRAGKSVLQAAMRRAASGSVIEIQDEGPYYINGFKLTDKNLTVRGRKGCRPVLVYDVTDEIRPSRIWEFDGGSVRIQGIDFVVHYRDADQRVAAHSVAFVHYAGRSLWLEDCSFTQSGDVIAEMPVVRVAPVRARPSDAAGSPLQQVTLRRCVVRGFRVAAVEVLGERVDFLLDECLFASPRAPMARLKTSAFADPDAFRRFHVVQSTVVTGAAVFDAIGSEPRRTGHRTHLGGLNSIFCGWADATQVALVRTKHYPAPASPDRRVTWRGVNNVFFGFKNYYVVREFNAHTPVSSGMAELVKWKAIWGDDACREPRELDPRFVGPFPETVRPARPEQFELAAASPERQGSLDLTPLGAPVRRLTVPVGDPASLLPGGADAGFD